MSIPNRRIGYKAFGLTIASDFKLPELQSINLEQRLSDVVVIKTDLSFEWTQLVGQEENFVIKPDFVMFSVPNVAIYFINNGREIFVSPLANSQEDQVRLYILGTCMGAILLQRRILPLHGSAVVIDGKAYAIIGDSGAGKSTLASAFLNKGYQLLSDDVIPITLSNEGVPIVTPAYPQQKLWLKSLEELGINSDHYRPIIGRETKFAVPVSNQFANNRTPLAGIFELIKTNSKEIKIYPIKSLERFHKLFLHTYRNFFVPPLGLLDWHFNMSANIIRSTKMYQLYRPTARFTAEELVEGMLKKIKKREKVL